MPATSRCEHVAVLAARPSLLAEVAAGRGPRRATWLPALVLPPGWPELFDADAPLRAYEQLFAALMARRYGPQWQHHAWSEEDCLAEAVLQEQLSDLWDQLDAAHRGQRPGPALLLA